MIMSWNMERSSECEKILLIKKNKIQIFCELI